MVFRRTCLSQPALAMLAALAMLTVPQAHAVGRLIDVQVIDRDSGETMPVYRHHGEHWVAGRPGARYAVSVRNASSARLLGVVSVDGVNVVSGETAAPHQTGYVLSPWQQYSVSGWRKSNSEVAAFHFTAPSASYAERTGRPAHVGVIGVAVFREKVVPPPALFMPDSAPVPHNRSQERGRYEAPHEPLLTNPHVPQNADLLESPAPAESMAMERRMAPASPAPSLGTGHGARERDWISHTTFDRRSQRPDELVRIRYDSHENLVAMGIIPSRGLPPRPNPFPGGLTPGYAPDPY
ncbi:MAG: hypothetical protein Q7V46_02890 [Hydrogenophaga sp.]|nr:hypothetical protein [Hydrogenophaga sp.]